MHFLNFLTLPSVLLKLQVLLSNLHFQKYVKIVLLKPILIIIQIQSLYIRFILTNIKVNLLFLIFFALYLFKEI
jgi:hypothetical protein